MSAAHVVCKQLGFSRGAASFNAGVFDESENSTIWLSNVNCRGDESNLAQCSHSYWGYTGCSHNEEVGIVCIRGMFAWIL